MSLSLRVTLILVILYCVDVKCPKCGGSMKLVGEDYVCERCGYPDLNYKTNYKVEMMKNWKSWF